MSGCKSCLGSPEKRWAAIGACRERRQGILSTNLHLARTAKSLLTGSSRFRWHCPWGPKPYKTVKPGKNKQKKEAEPPQEFLGAYHQEGHGDSGFRAVGQRGHGQLEGVLAFPGSRDSPIFSLCCCRILLENAVKPPAFCRADDLSGTSVPHTKTPYYSWCMM